MGYSIFHYRQYVVVIEVHLAVNPHPNQQSIRKKCRVTYLAMFLWTKISPGLDPVITDSGTLESEQPIHNTYIDSRDKRPNNKGDRGSGGGSTTDLWGLRILC